MRWMQYSWIRQVGMILAIATLTLLGFFSAPSAHGAAPVQGLPMVTYRSPSCSCCGSWLDHVEAEGFQNNDQVTADMDAIKAELGIPEALSSCHTALIDGYLIEGHVPVADIQRLLAERPHVAGLTVPGMPVGSPGMESGDTHDAYRVLAFYPDGTTEPFHDYPAGE